MLRWVFCAMVFLAFVGEASARPHHQRVQRVTHRVVQQQQQQPNFFQAFEGLFSDRADYGSTKTRRGEVQYSRRQEEPRRRERITHEEARRVSSENRKSIHIAIEFGQHADGTLERPGDCYGIQWCGCWLRHHFGLSDKSLNVASAWAKVGSATSPHSGAIAVWHHHVGVLESEPDQEGKAILLSGNSRRRSNQAWRSRISIRGAIAFRQL